MRLLKGWKVLRQLGLTQSYHWASYQLGLRSGWYALQTPAAQPVETYDPSPLSGPFHLPGSAELADLVGMQLSALLVEAEEIVAGQFRPFAGPTAPIQLTSPGPLAHWTVYENQHLRLPGVEDIKLLWEPARFGWVFPLGRAYQITHDERYAETFWRFAERFWQTNPPNQGPQWTSGQEVALRLIAFLFAGQVFTHSPHSTPQLLARLRSSVAAHARRIPVTLRYAQAQNNNHLLSEACGIYAAGVVLTGHPQAKQWRRLGHRWIEWCCQHQIGEDGTYVQHSTNYHRLMLHLALLAWKLAQQAGQPLSTASVEKLAAAVRWLGEHTDPVSGQMVNLGANDGALLLPLASAGFRDARPTLQAASCVFCGEAWLPAGPWDELAIWLGLPIPSGQPFSRSVTRGKRWGSMRVVQFRERPSHADQLHVDLWANGVNIATDPGTFAYNMPAPWDNSLASALVHNTVTIDGQEPMTKAGKFLWLDWDQARWVSQGAEVQTAERSGYRRLGVIHRRSLEQIETGWRITDELRPTRQANNQTHRIRMHWLLPDWPWSLVEPSAVLQFQSPVGTLQVRVQSSQADPPLQLTLVRAGELVAGNGPAAPFLGWVSPTYGVKEPALSLIVEQTTAIPAELITLFQFFG